MTNQEQAPGYRAVTWGGIKVVVDADDQDAEGNYILSIYEAPDGECTVNVGLTPDDLRHLASILEETAPAYNFADLRSGLEDIRDEKGDWRGTVDWLLTTLPDAAPEITDCQSCQ